MCFSFALSPPPSCGFWFWTFKRVYLILILVSSSLLAVSALYSVTILMTVTYHACPLLTVLPSLMFSLLPALWPLPHGAHHSAAG
jgi:hypothetical protein